MKRIFDLQIIQPKLHRASLYIAAFELLQDSLTSETEVALKIRTGR